MSEPRLCIAGTTVGREEAGALGALLGLTTLVGDGVVVAVPGGLTPGGLTARGMPLASARSRCSIAVFRTFLESSWRPANFSIGAAQPRCEIRQPGRAGARQRRGQTRMVALAAAPRRGANWPFYRRLREVLGHNGDRARQREPNRTMLLTGVVRYRRLARQQWLPAATIERLQWQRLRGDAAACVRPIAVLSPPLPRARPDARRHPLARRLRHAPGHDQRRPEGCREPDSSGVRPGAHQAANLGLDRPADHVLLRS